ncbi:MAG: inositol monophosphatase, partial [Candidatus Hydrogenedentota bacterium]
MLFSEDEFTLLKNTIVEAGKHILSYLDKKHLQIDFKSAVDLVTEADKFSEDFLCTRLIKHFPEDSILAEEGFSYTGTKGRWILDPLDGTTSFAHGFPFFAISLAYERDNKVQVGMVYNPM